MSTTNFEAMLEALVNEDHETAKQIFHSIVVDKSRKIYEELLAEDMGYYEETDEDETPDFGKDDDEDDFGAEDDEFGSDDDFAQDDEGTDDFDDSEFGDEEEGEGDIEDRVMDLEDALDDLKAEFERLMADEEGEPEHDDLDFDSEGDEFGDETGPDEFGAEDDGESDDEMNKMFEYVNKVALPKHGDDGVNSKSIVAKKNDMGGTTANIAKGGTSEKGGTEGGLLKPTTQDLKSGNVNVPGAKSATKLTAVPKGHGAEKKGTRETAQNKQSIIRGR